MHEQLQQAACNTATAGCFSSTWRCTAARRPPQRFHASLPPYNVSSPTFYACPQVILNSEVWDLRTLRLLRSVPSLDGATVMFNGGGDVLYAVGGSKGREGRVVREQCSRGPRVIHRGRRRAACTR